MITVWIPSLLRSLTGGVAQIEVDAESLRELIDRMDERHPGIKDRLVSDDRVKPNIAVVVNGVNSRGGLRQTLDDGSEVHFVPAISGGAIHRGAIHGGAATGCDYQT